MSKAMRALGTKLKIGESATVAGLTSIGGLDLSADTIDVTSLDSDGGYREFLAGFKDAGEVSLEGFFMITAGEDNGQSQLYKLFEDGDEEDFSIVFPPKTKTLWQFKGIVTGFGTSAAVEDPVSFSATIKVSGEPKLVIGTA